MLRRRFNISPIAWPSLLTGTLGLVVCVCAALVGTDIWQLMRVHAANVEQTEIVTANTARSLAEQAESTLRTADMIAASVVERVEAEGTGPEALTRLQHLTTSLTAALPAIHEMGLLDSHGDVIIQTSIVGPTTLNYSEREYFRFHATHADRGPFVGERIRSKVDGTTNITVTRRINNPDGSFAGLAVTTVSMLYFQHLFDQIQAKSGGIITLFGGDGTVLARSPAIPADAPPIGGNGSPLWRQMRQHPIAGTATYQSTLDGVWRHGSYQHLSQFPLTMLVAQSNWAMQKTWRAELWSHAIVLVCVMVVVAVLGGRAVSATRMLAAQALQDGLTGLANRRSFDETIERELRRAARSDQVVSMIMMDIDHFKDYNDCHGHLAGDECLRMIARVIQDCLRRSGEVASRYGGEEIAVLLPGCGTAQTYALAETIRLAVRGLAMPQARHIGGGVTLSAGVATYQPGQDQSEARALIGRADAAMYAAKAAGRDTVRIAPALQVVSRVGTVEAFVT
ncbi:MAG TPA: sensor domain-containing diguanylate cyclase [Rhodopila sp.]